jgi:tripeptidyl-peptidase-1
MLLTGLLTLVASLSSTHASPTSKYAKHTLVESRSMVPEGWNYAQKLDRNVVLPMRIGLVQSNLDMLEDYLMDVSSPHSSNWGKHWSADEIAKAFSPSAETIDAVHAWLASSGIAEERVRTSTSAGWLHFNATVAEAEELLHAEYHVYEHEDSGTPHIACKSYKVPEAVRHHIGLRSNHTIPY